MSLRLFFLLSLFVVASMANSNNGASGSVSGPNGASGGQGTTPDPVTTPHSTTSAETTESTTTSPPTPPPAQPAPPNKQNTGGKRKPIPSGKVLLKDSPTVPKSSDDVERGSLKYVKDGKTIIVRAELLQSHFATRCHGNPCGDHGSCVVQNEGTVLEKAICYCDYGFRGTYCEQEFRTKLTMTAFFWGIFLVEIAFLTAAFIRSSNVRVFELHPAALPVVDLLQRKNL